MNNFYFDFRLQKPLKIQCNIDNYRAYLWDSGILTETAPITDKELKNIIKKISAELIYTMKLKNMIITKRKHLKLDYFLSYQNLSHIRLTMLHYIVGDYPTTLATPLN